MDWNLFFIFCALNIVNVIIQTVKSICTINSGRVVASLVNALAYGLYTVVVVYMVCDLDLWVKVAVIAIANLIGVYIVKTLEEKSRKDKLWKIEMTVPTKYLTAVEFDLKDIPHNSIDVQNNYTIINFYCATQKESQKVREITKQYSAKYFVSESKIL